MILVLLLSQLSNLAVMKPTFDDTEAVAGLKMKPPKCIIVPTGAPFEHALEAPRSNTRWKEFLVKPFSKHLGFILGPAA